MNILRKSRAPESVHLPPSSRRLQRAAWLATGFLVYFPFLILFARSLFPDGDFSFQSYLDLIDTGDGDLRLFILFRRSLFLAAGSALLSLALGVLLAYFLETRRIPCRPAFRLLALSPLIFPPYMQVAVWKPILGGLVLQEEGIRIPLAILILGFSYAPLVFFFASQGIRGISGDLLDAARHAPLPERTVAARIIFPLAAPAISTGTAIVFVLSFLDVEIPALLLIPAYSMEIFHRIALGSGAAFAAALPMLILTLAAVTVSERWAGRRGFSVTGSENPRAPLPLRRIELPALLLLFFLLGILVAFPLIRLFWMSGSPGTFSQAYWLYGSTLIEGVPITLSSAALATVLAALTLGRSGRPSLPASLFAWIPLAMPGTVLGAALIEMYNRPALGVIYESWGILVISSAVRFFPIAYHALAWHLRTVPRELWEVAELAQLPAPIRLIKVYLPLAAPGLALSAVAVAIFQSGELASSVLIAPPGHRPIPVVISSELHYNVNLEVPAALCLFQVAVVLFMIGAIFLLARWLVPDRASDRTKGKAT